MIRCPDRLAFLIWTSPWLARMPAPLWAVTSSPLLRWASSPRTGPWVMWPKTCSRNPLRLSFWWVAAGDLRRSPPVDPGEYDMLE